MARLPSTSFSSNRMIASQFRHLAAIVWVIGCSPGLVQIFAKSYCPYSIVVLLHIGRSRCSRRSSYSSIRERGSLVPWLLAVRDQKRTNDMFTGEPIH
jgi:hypothetical protein